MDKALLERTHKTSICPRDGAAAEVNPHKRVCGMSAPLLLCFTPFVIDLVTCQRHHTIRSNFKQYVPQKTKIAPPPTPTLKPEVRVGAIPPQGCLPELGLDSALRLLPRYKGLLKTVHQNPSY